MHVKDVMTHAVVSVAPEETAAVAARLLSRNNVGSLPVCASGGTLEGMITDRDIVLRCVAANRDPQKTQVRDIMTNRVVSVTPDDDAQKAADLMGAEQIRRLPVSDRGRVVGMVALGDLAVRSDWSMEAGECLSEISQNIRRK